MLRVTTGKTFKELDEARSVTCAPVSEYCTWSTQPAGVSATPLARSARYYSRLREVSGVASLEVTATSSEPSDGAPDVVVTQDESGAYVVQLRAARLGTGKGRVYTVTARATDLADNTRTMTATCVVPHSQ